MLISRIIRHSCLALLLALRPGLSAADACNTVRVSSIFKQELSTVPETPIARNASQVFKSDQKVTVATSGFKEQVALLTKTVPGLTREQAEVLLKNAFDRKSSIVFGGSRIRGNFTPASDLDVGFGSLSKAQAGKIIDKASRMGPLRIERTQIVPGNQTANIPRIQSPEEFFQRQGIRSAVDPKSGQPYYASGSISAYPDGTIIFLPPGAQP